MFQHHPDGYIIIQDVLMPLAEFLVYEPDYTGLPIGAIGRLYDPGVRHALTNGQQATGGPLPWPDGDVYLSKVEVYRTRHPNFPAMEQAVTTFEAVQAAIAASLAVDHDLVSVSPSHV